MLQDLRGRLSVLDWFILPIFQYIGFFSVCEIHVLGILLEHGAFRFEVFLCLIWIFFLKLLVLYIDLMGPVKSGNHFLWGYGEVIRSGVVDGASGGHFAEEGLSFGWAFLESCAKLEFLHERLDWFFFLLFEFVELHERGEVGVILTLI